MPKKKNKKLLLSNTTNSKLPDDQLSRIFIGSLNTNQISKKHILKLFCKFGQIKAISIHKGYCFVQYFYKEHAKAAIDKMHGQLVGGQLIDVNLVTDPRRNQKKVISPSCSSNESEIKIVSLLGSEMKNSFKDSSIESIQKSDESFIEKRELYATQNTAGSTIQKLHESPHDSSINYSSFSKTAAKNKPPIKSNHQIESFDTLFSSFYEQKSSSRTNVYQPFDFANKPIQTVNSDVMICGSCRSIFHNFDLFIQHKQTFCLFTSTNICITNAQ